MKKYVEKSKSIELIRERINALHNPTDGTLNNYGLFVFNGKKKVYTLYPWETFTLQDLTLINRQLRSGDGLKVDTIPIGTDVEAREQTTYGLILDPEYYLMLRFSDEGIPKASNKETMEYRSRHSVEQL